MVKDGIYLSGRYQVLSKIGAGGMADVYKAKDCMLNGLMKVMKTISRQISVHRDMILSEHGHFIQHFVVLL